LMENVPGLGSSSRIHYLNYILNSISELGYSPSWKIVNSAHYGVPQNRRRLFVLALRNRAPWFPMPTHGPDKPNALVPSGSVVSHIPIGEPLDCPVVYAKHPDPRPSPYAGLVYNGGGRPINLEAPCPTILASAGGYKTHWVDTEEIAPAYTRHLLNGGTPRDGLVPGARRLTVKESALIQSFPEDLEFAGSRSSVYTQVGDSVPPILAEKIAECLIEQMLGLIPDTNTHVKPNTFQPSLI